MQTQMLKLLAFFFCIITSQNVLSTEIFFFSSFDLSNYYFFFISTHVFLMISGPKILCLLAEFTSVSSGIVTYQDFITIFTSAFHAI